MYLSFARPGGPTLNDTLPTAPAPGDNDPVICGSSVEPFWPTRIKVSRTKLTKAAGGAAPQPPSPSGDYNDFGFGLPS